MRRAILIMAFTPVLIGSGGCGLFKTRFKETKKEAFSQTLETQTETKKVFSQIDKSIILERSKLDTTIKLPYKFFDTSTAFDFSQLTAGLTLVDSSLVSVKVVLDTTSNRLKTTVTLKPRDVPLTFDKSVTTYKDLTTNAGEITDQAVKLDTDRTSKESQTTTEPAGLAWLWGIAAIIGLFIFFKKPGI